MIKTQHDANIQVGSGLDRSRYDKMISDKRSPTLLKKCAANSTPYKRYGVPAADELLWKEVLNTIVERMAH